jgi:hypothetical protein
MYETLAINGGKVDHKDDVRRDDLAEATSAFLQLLADGAAYIAAETAGQVAALQASVAGASRESGEIVEEIRSSRYTTFEQDVGVIVEDLKERMTHMATLKQRNVQLAAYASQLGLPEVCTLVLGELLCVESSG